MNRAIAHKIGLSFDTLSMIAAACGVSSSSGLSRDNKHMVAQPTVANGDRATPIPLAVAPVGVVGVYVNGVRVPLGDNSTPGYCYFSGDGGATKRNLNTIVTGDTLHWLGSVAGYQLTPSDMIDFEYEA